MDFHLYPEIRRYSDKNPIILFKEIIAQEKADGINVRVGVVNNTYCVGGRNVEYTDDEKLDPFGAKKWLDENEVEKRLRASYDGVDIILFGEFYGKGIQKHINYGHKKYFRIFDVMISDVWLDPDDVEDVAKKLSMETMPTVYKGTNYLPILEKYAVELTVVGVPREGNLREGIVVRPPVRLNNKNGRTIIAKVKNPAFDEIIPEPSAPRPGIQQDTKSKILRYVSLERLNHILTHLREENVILDETATGIVIRRMIEDVMKEADNLDSTEQKAIGKTVPSEARRLYFQYMREAKE